MFLICFILIIVSRSSPLDQIGPLLHFTMMNVLNSISVYIPLVIFVWLPLFIWYKLRRLFLYWDRHGVPSVRGAPILGNLKPICFFEKQTALHFNDLYNDKGCTDSVVVGIHVYLKPALIVRDLELIRAILIKDFASFRNRYAK